jgi:predicted transcriptional regulator
MRITQTYDRHGYKARVIYKNEQGKRKQVTQTFSQTINPWNEKSWEQILKEEQEKINKWFQEMADKYGNVKTEIEPI